MYNSKAYATFSFCTMLHNYSTEAYSTFEVKISFQIDILPKMLTQKRKRTDLNQAENASYFYFTMLLTDKSTNSFTLAWQTKEKEYSFATSLIFFLFYLP